MNISEVNIKTINYVALETNASRIQALYDGKEIGHIVLSEIYDDSNYSPEFDGKEVFDFVENFLLTKYDFFYSLDYLFVEPEYRLCGISDLLLKYLQNHYRNKPILLCISSYSVNNDLKKQMNSKILPTLYKKYGFKQIMKTNYYCNVNA